MYTKFVNDGYIVFVSPDNSGNVEITESEYNEIMTAIKNKPTPSKGKGYRLKEDLTWEEYDLPVPSDDDEITDEEAFAIITGESV